MNMKFILTLIITCSSVLIFGQSREFEVNYRYGISTNNLTVLQPNTLTRADFKEIQSVWDQGIEFYLRREVFKKIHFSVCSGFNLSRTKHFQRIVEGDGRYHLDNILINSNRIEFEYGFNQDLRFKSGLTFYAGWSLVYRRYFKDSKQYFSDFKSNNEDWIEYSYDLKTYYNDYYESELNHSGQFGNHFRLGLKYPINDQFKLNVGLSLTTHNNFFYDFEYWINYYVGGSEDPTSTYHFGGIMGTFPDTKFGIRDDNLFFKVGLTYLLNQNN